MPFRNSTWCTLCFGIVLLAGVSHGLLNSEEKDALTEIFSSFPKLGSTPVYSNIDELPTPYGRSWTYNFDSLCGGGDGYDYYGLYCSNGHIGGIMIDTNWGDGILRNFSNIDGLRFLKNLTIPIYQLSETAERLVFGIVQVHPLERMSCASNTLFGKDSFPYPSLLLELRAAVSEDFDITPFSNLRSLALDPIVNVMRPNLGVWPPSLESFRFRHALAMDYLFDLVAELTTVKHFNVRGYAYQAGNGTLVSESIETLVLSVQHYDNYLLTINSSSLKIASIDSEFSPMVLNTPNLQKLTFTRCDGFQTGSTELQNLEELTIYDLESVIPDLGFAINLSRLSLENCILEPSDLSSMLCNISANNQYLSSINIAEMMAPSVTLTRSEMTPSNSLSFELPACLRDAGHLKSLSITGNDRNLDVKPFSAASLQQALPPSLERLKLFVQLDNDTNIDSFTHLGQLKELHLEDLRFVGEMKNDFFSKFPNLEKLYLKSPSVNGTIPNYGWANLRWIEILCPVNQWTGLDSAPYLNFLHIESRSLKSIPNDSQLANLLELEVFYVRMTPASISMPTPSFWTRLPKLSVFFIFNAHFHGPIASPIAAPRLRILGVAETWRVCGPLPDFDIPTRLHQLHLSGNQLSGTIPKSWETNLSILSYISLARNKLSGTIPSGLLSKMNQARSVAAFDRNYFSGPVWSISQNYSQLSLSYNNFDICGNIPRSAYVSIDKCLFLDVSVCPEDASECFASWNRSCTNFQCSTHSEARVVPPLQDCIASAPFNPTDTQCPPPGPPGFSCINGQWTSNGSLTIPSVTLPPNGGVILVIGNLSVNGSLTFDGTGTSLVVEECVEKLPTEVLIVLKEDEKLEKTTILSQKGSECLYDLRSIPVSLIQKKNDCKKVRSSTKDSTRSSLIVAFEIDSHKCNVKWIILGSVLGGIIILAAACTAILFHLSRRFRTFVRSCNPKNSARKSSLF